MGWELSTASQVTTPIHPIDSPEDGKLTIGTPLTCLPKKDHENISSNTQNMVQILQSQILHISL